jgi:hypothetical protein
MTTQQLAEKEFDIFWKGAERQLRFGDRLSIVVSLTVVLSEFLCQSLRNPDIDGIIEGYDLIASGLQVFSKLHYFFNLYGHEISLADIVAAHFLSINMVVKSTPIAGKVLCVSNMAQKLFAVKVGKIYNRSLEGWYSFLRKYQPPSGNIKPAIK